MFHDVGSLKTLYVFLSANVIGSMFYLCCFHLENKSALHFSTLLLGKENCNFQKNKRYIDRLLTLLSFQVAPSVEQLEPQPQMDYDYHTDIQKNNSNNNINTNGSHPPTTVENMRNTGGHQTSSNGSYTH